MSNEPDFNRIAALLHVVEKTRDYPKLKTIHDAAMAELEQHANPETLEAEQEPGAAAQDEGLAERRF